MEADEALALFARELIADAVALASGNVPPVAPQAGPGMPPLPVPARTGAGAVHPHLGGHLLTPLPRDTISGHAYAHVPRPYEPQAPDAKTVRLLDTQAQLQAHQDALDRVREYRQAAAELDRHSASLKKQGIALPGTWKPWTPEEHDSHARYAEDALTRALDAGQATSRTETLDGHGQVWKPERAAMHRDIVQEAMEKARTVPAGHRAVLVGGIPSPARDSVAKQAAPEKDYLHVSTDQVKQELARRGVIPQLNGLSPMESSPLVHEEAEHIADLITREALRRGKSVAVHTAMASPDAIAAHARRMRQAGHTVHGVFVHTPPGKAADAARSRHRSGHEAWRQEKNDGAKYVPPSVVRSAETAPGSSVNAGAFEQAKPALGSWEHWDATESPRKIAGSGRPDNRTIPVPEELARG